MYWEEDSVYDINKIKDKIVDVSFKVDCEKISVDHAYDLFEAISSILPIINNIDNLMFLNLVIIFVFP